jgi:hypothetical protein
MTMMLGGRPLVRLARRIIGKKLPSPKKDRAVIAGQRQPMTKTSHGREQEPPLPAGPQCNGMMMMLVSLPVTTVVDRKGRRLTRKDPV